ADGPAILFVQNCLIVAGIDHWLDREDKAGPQQDTCAWLAEVRHRGFLVQFLADSMAGPLAHDRAAICLDVGLDRRAHIAESLARLCRADAAPHRLLRYRQQLAGLRRNLAYWVGHTGVAIPAVQPRADINANDITRAQRRLAREPVANHLVRRH